MNKKDEKYYIAKTFDLVAKSYDKRLKKKKIAYEFYSNAIKYANLKEGYKVLDAGCGTGTLAIMIKKQVSINGYVAGIDISNGMLEKAKQKAKIENLSIDFKEAPIEDIPFQDDYFDVVTSTWVIHQLKYESKIKAFNEILRILKPKGHFLIVDLHKINNPFRAFFNLPFYWWSNGYKIHVLGRLPELLVKIGYIEVKTVFRLDNRIEYISAIKE
jgi:ubiquinone/menaquinone biosynthesis C-methylase UbiE